MRAQRVRRRLWKLCCGFTGALECRKRVEVSPEEYGECGRHYAAPAVRTGFLHPAEAPGGGTRRRHPADLEKPCKSLCVMALENNGGICAHKPRAAALSVAERTMETLSLGGVCCGRAAEWTGQAEADGRALVQAPSSSISRRSFLVGRPAPLGRQPGKAGSRSRDFSSSSGGVKSSAN
ncbi:MAG: hypothetical protein RLZZ253_2788 [Verrucomicrobiota bacterium]